MLTEERKQEIIRRLVERIPALECPMCHQHSGFTLVNGYYNTTIQDNYRNFQLGGTSIPSVAIICNNCGFISQHALGSLGLLERVENNNVDNGGNENG